MATKGLIHCGAEYHIKYAAEISHWINSIVATKYKSEISERFLNKKDCLKLVEERGIDFVLSLSNSGKSSIYSTASVAGCASSMKSLIWCGHTYILSCERLKYVLPQDINQKSVLPSYFNSDLGINKEEGVFFYDGHFKTAFHYSNPPIKNETVDGVLYLPDVNSDADKISREIKSIPKDVYILPHPGEYESSSIGRKNKLGGDLEKYKKIVSGRVIEGKNNLEVLDMFPYIMSNYNSSVLVESVIRGKIYGRNTYVLCTDTSNSSVRKIGIQSSARPSIGDFGLINENVMEQCCLPYDKIRHNFVEQIINAITDTELTEEQIEDLKERFYYRNKQ